MRADGPLRFFAPCIRAGQSETSRMSKRQSAKYKINRRLGENLWGRPKSPVNRRDYGPGQHGQRRKPNAKHVRTVLVYAGCNASEGREKAD